MKLNDFMDMMACLREETEKFCRGEEPTLEDLYQLGGMLAEKYRKPPMSRLSEFYILLYIMKYGGKGK